MAFFLYRSGKTKERLRNAQDALSAARMAKKIRNDNADVPIDELRERLRTKKR